MTTTLKRVMRYDSDNRMFRLFRIMWERGVVGDGNGYSAKVSLALTPRLFRWQREGDGWLLTFFGLRLHYRRSYGGRFT
jgi:hypothetical protein